MAARQQVLQFALLDRGPQLVRHRKVCEAAPTSTDQWHRNTVQCQSQSRGSKSFARSAALASRFAQRRRQSCLRKRENRRPFLSTTPTSAKQAKITFQQDSTQTEEKYYLETMGTGVAWIDYDQDGLMDLYFVQSAATDIYKPPHPLRSALYHNNGDGTFTDVTEKAGVGGEGHYGQGVAVGDFDNDGYPDLYVTGYGRAILYHNNGNGTFTDVTAKAGVADEGGWSTSAGWFDYDKDGWLDLVVTNYIDWSPKNNIWCGERRPGYRSYCHPGNYKGQTHQALSQQSRRNFHRCERRIRRGQARGQGNGRGARRFQQRRLARHRHRQ